MSNTVPITTKDSPQYLKDRQREQMEQPFTTIDTPPRKKLYLILRYITDDEGGEDIRDFEFFKGTTQELYDKLRMELLEDKNFDAMKSRVLVDAPNISISHKCSVFMFMKDTKDLKKIEDNTAFDIMDYYYDIENVEGGDDVVG